MKMSNKPSMSTAHNHLNFFSNTPHWRGDITSNVRFQRMKRLLQIIFLLMALPTIILFCVMTIPVVLFALPSVFIGNPLNLLFVIWWGIGAYGIWSGIRAAISFFREHNYRLSQRHQTGIILGILAFLPIIPLSYSGQIGFEAISTYIIRSSFLGILPAVMLLISSWNRPTTEPPR